MTDLPSCSARCHADTNISILELATLLASAYLRLAEMSRRSAVSLTERRRYSLEVPAEIRPDVRDGGATP